MENKVIAFPAKPQVDSILDTHFLTLRKNVQNVFGDEMSQENFAEQLPLVKWQECKKVPGAFLIYLLSSAHGKQDIHLFFHEMVSKWLVAGQELDILSSKNLTFQLKEKGNQAYYFIEVLVHVENEKHLALIHRNLPSLADEIKLGALSKSYAKHLLELKRHSIGGKTSFIYETIVSLMQRRPKNFAHDIFREVQRFLIHTSEEFRDLRDMKHLCRIILSHYLFEKSIQINLKGSAETRLLHFKLLKTHLHYPVGLKKVLGLAITLNSLRDYECFEERHVLKAIQRILPNAVASHDSFISHRHDETKVLSLYIEVEKSDGTEFSLEELILLRKKLGSELKNSIEYLTPTLFTPRNEEELYRNIITLSHELKYVSDLPQAIISFQEQVHDTLKFNVTLLRVLHKNSSSLQSLSHELSPSDRFILERVTPVGTLRKKYIKEASVFALEVESRHFLRKNHSVDLVKARQYVVSAIEKLVGHFRDYNGGFLLKQNEQLEAIKKEWGEEEKHNELLIENLFYSLTPSILQTLIQPDAGRALFTLFLRSIEENLPKQQGFLFHKVQHSHSLSVVIKARTSEMREKLQAAIKDLEIDALKLASALIEHEGFYYICYLYLEPSSQETTRFCSALAATLENLAQHQLNIQTVRLYLPCATQSLDPRIGADRASGIVIKMLYEGLMRTADDGGIECAIAEKVKISSDKKRYTFTLKETKWSNGSLLTAFDFEYAWKTILSPTFTSPYSFLLFSIKNAEKVKKGELPLSEVGIQVIDKKTLVVDLEYPAPYFLGLTAHWTYSPLCCEIDQRHPGWAYQSAETHVSNGPFKLDSWKFNDDIAVAKNPLYWDAESVKLDKIEVAIIENESTASELYKRGQLDWYGDPIRKMSLKEMKHFSDSKTLSKTDQKGFFWLQINIEHPIFSNAKLRRAFALAVNRKSLIDKILQRDDEPALRFIMEKSDGNPLLKDGDTMSAQTLFEAGLEEAGLKRAQLGPLVITHSDIGEHEALSREIGHQWQEAFCIDVKYERLMWNNYFDTLHKRHDFMIGGLSWYSRYEDPLYYLDLLIPREGTPSVTRWKNPRFADLIEKAKREGNTSKREKLILEAEELVLEEMPLIPILFDKWRYVKNPRLKGVLLSTIGHIDFRAAYIEKQG